MSKPSNQQLRARKDLLEAASRLMRNGVTPNMAEVAAEAFVSRATAYRYFKTIEHLLAEAPANDAVADPASVFGEVASNDPGERLAIVEILLHEATYRNEAQMRIMLAHSLQQAPGENLPVRQNRRTPLIDAALEPVRGSFSDDVYTQLSRSLALVMGTESMIVCQDVLNIDEDSAREVKSWAVNALLRAALLQPK